MLDENVVSGVPNDVRGTDIKIAATVGFIAGTFGIVPLVHLSLAPVVFAILLPVSLSLLAVVGVCIAYRTRHIVPASIQAARFLIVGGTSTLVELGVLNILFMVTGLTMGVAFSIFKTITYLLGFGNSYFLNTRWTFERIYLFHGREFMKFAASNIFALILNVGTASFVVNGIAAPEGISSAGWANIGAAIAVFVVMIWNFLSYRYIVFTT